MCNVYTYLLDKFVKDSAWVYMNISFVQVQPGVVYNNSVLILLSKPVASSSDSYINIAQITWVVSKVATATSPAVLVL